MHELGETMEFVIVMRTIFHIADTGFVAYKNKFVRITFYFVFWYLTRLVSRCMIWYIK